MHHTKLICSLQLEILEEEFVEGLLQERRAPFNIAAHGAGDIHRVFELCVHPAVLRAACCDIPEGSRQWLVERACSHVEQSNSSMSLNRSRLHMRVRC